MKSLLVISVVAMVMPLVWTDKNDGIMTEVLREQMKLIKHCMTTSCHGYGYKPPVKPPQSKYSQFHVDQCGPPVVTFNK